MLFPTHYVSKPPVGVQPIRGHPLTPNVGVWLFNEGSGLKAFDLSGNGNHGTFGAGAAAPSWVLEGLSFNDETINCGNSSTLNQIIKGLSITIWVNGGNNSKRYSHFVSTTNPWSDENGYALSYNDRNVDNRLRFYFDRYVGSHVVSTTALVDGNWYCVECNYDGDKMSISINGVEEASQSGVTLQANTKSLIIGDSSTGADATTFYVGVIGKLFLSDFSIRGYYTVPYGWLTQPMGAELMYAAPPIGAIMNQFQRANLGADLYDGVLIT